MYVAGQTASVPAGPPVDADDLAGQVAQTLRNTATALAGAGATFDNVVRMTFYVTSWTPDQIGPFMDGADSVADEIGLPMPMPPASLIGVEHLFEPAVLVELEVTAILD
ncbi:hypothetical protein GS4_26_00390 [Gordonia soli NBRC 108243]|uniref:Uncharacterized protein n=1 Tax=Gordonia soli NBRC 108243 TaxID=1223545 RepID=M0QMS0_9ACTN|nr:hypothetical protein GS4_26_00390 [Gordonia soli NBRC 108243]